MTTPPLCSEPAVRFGREICGSLEAAEQREWLVTNGIGGYASGTISGNLTRRYHGMLVAALEPPVGRKQLVSQVEENVLYHGGSFPLSTNRWTGGAVEPKGFLYIESFYLDGSVPVWRFALDDALLEKRIWMVPRENTTCIQYTLLRGAEKFALELKTLVNYRDFHSLTHAEDWHMQIHPVQNGLEVVAFEGATPLFLFCHEAHCEPRHDWYKDSLLPRETERGLADSEDHLLAAVFRAELGVHQALTLVLTTERTADIHGALAKTAQASHESKVLSAWNAHRSSASVQPPRWIRQLVLAADQFIVKRSLPKRPEGRSIIAGYHWFGDWGRDTMIALPGLTLTTGRAEIAAAILLAFSDCVDQGMLPNNFPDAGGQPAYNTVDAALWYFEAVRQYVAATNDLATLAKLFPILAEIVSSYDTGTRYRIHADPADGLLFAGEPGVQLTWMDAKVDDRVVTPRIGKPVEINALWFNALETMADLAPLLGQSHTPFAQMAAKAKTGFAKFWNAKQGCCYDVIDAPEIGNDASFRPNQIFAVSLPKSPLTGEQQKSVVDACAMRLLTSHGLRSLAPGEPGFQSHYGGTPSERDGAYHQGTVWGWLLGPFALAHFRAYGDAAAASAFLEPLGRQITAYGVGSLGEIFDGQEPFTPRGCIAQAWTVAEVLRAWHQLHGVG